MAETVTEVSKWTAFAATGSVAVCCVFLGWNAYLPEVDLVTGAGLAAVVAVQSAAVSMAAWLVVKWKARSNRAPILILGALVLVTLALHLSIVNASGADGCVAASGGFTGCISDEQYYVPAAQTLLAGTQCSPSVFGCNLEHPFLGKALIAAGIAVFGQGALGERFASIVFGALSIPVVFLLVEEVSGNRRFGYAAAGLLALDPLFFSQSSAAFLDVPSLFFCLCAIMIYFSGKRVWRLDSLTLAGIMIGAAALVKETAMFILLTLVVFHTLFKEGEFSGWLKDLAKMGGASAAVFIAGLQAYDSLLAKGSFQYFYQHIGYILGFGSSLIGTGWIDTAWGTPITPLSWVTIYTPVAYFTASSSLSVPGPGGVPLYPAVGYYASTNLILSWTLYLWIPLALLLAAGYIRTRGALSPSDGDEKLLFLAGIWFACVFVPYVGLWLFGRDTYPYYIILATPAMALGTGYLITRGWFNKWAAWIIVAAALLGFVYFFPDKSAMPDWLRYFFPR